MVSLILRSFSRHFMPACVFFFSIYLHIPKFLCTFAVSKIFMKEETRLILYKIDRSFGLAFKIVTILAFLLLILGAFYSCLRSAVFASWAIWGLILIIKICLSPFVKSEDDEDFEQKVEYILQQKRLLLSEKAYSPLRGLSPEQEEKIKQLIHDLPEHTEKPGHINLAFIAQYLTALEKLGKADLKDKRRLRLWIAEVTEKEVPKSSQFNEAIPSTASTKVASARKELENILQ